MKIISNMLHSIKNLFVKSNNSSTLTGTIKFYDRKKRFGFIISGKNEYFFHAAATNVANFKSLKDGVVVSFILIKGKKGLQSDNIKIISKER